MPIEKCGCLPNLQVSFSGGRTSGYMAYMLKKYCSNMFNLFFVFANTGQEREETLEFVDMCDKHFGLSVVWVEAVVDPEKGKGTRHRVVDFKTASRDGEPFEDVIKKYGISNKSYPHCTRELKLAPMLSFSKIFGEYKTAIGIRADEYRRVRNDENIIYPLVDMWLTDKAMVNDFWGEQPFDLKLRDYEGNCSWCWKKSNKKLFRLIDERPEIFDFPRRMEKLYQMAGASGNKQVFFRKHLSTNDLFALREEYLESKKGKFEQSQISLFDMETDDGCSESCEMYEAI